MFRAADVALDEFARPDVTEEAPPMADRLPRLAAGLVDAALLAPAAVPFFGAIASGYNGLDATGIAAAAAACVMAFGVAGAQAFLIVSAGQSIGKRLFGLRIVRVDGRPVDFLHGVLKRGWFFAALSGIPYVGLLVRCADIVLMFSADRRCLHDHLAGTKVVRTVF